MSDENRMAILDIESKKDESVERNIKNHDQRIRKVLSNFKSDSELWSFLTKNIEMLDNIKDWNIYRRATQTTRSCYTGS